MSVAVSQTIRTALRQPVEPWFPGLAGVLTGAAWRRFGRRGFAADNYGTHRWLSGDPNAERRESGSFSLGGTRGCRIEGLPESTRRRYERHGLVFRKGACSANATALESATSLTALVPSLHAAVSAYLHTVHVLDAPSADHDVSHSDPAVPFSVFVSIPSCERTGRLRLAESLIHECMHLQLTMIEGVQPLVEHTRTLIFSPWQQSLRPLGGVLHGLYVFAVMDACYEELSKRPSLSADEKALAVKRRKEIEQEVWQVSQIQTAGGLTDDGRALAGYALKRFLV